MITKITKIDFKRHAVTNGLAMLGVTKRPFSDLSQWIGEQPSINGMRDEVRLRADGTLFRKFERDGKTVESALHLDKYATVYKFPNGWLAVHCQYPAEPGCNAWENTIVYA
jgi:hypothetical protein